ncbi:MULTISPECIES: low affinity iron permease family protein [Asticcacaulis]|uniref:low affinity iron permease family protein n=1 Tax=Asticcacaulis TaxID=76890 RepID=UPI001AE86F27|nr:MULTISPECIES: low affinity iron permease family protein [Asticcacaulis]MBP2161352.1 low affinity Fe/Cu permease [Asticcacaulis solisilvae]MDR6802397.1 low affinity Fe/Cu permease [Asticcacaulis sp. BE141]
MTTNGKTPPRQKAKTAGNGAKRRHTKAPEAEVAETSSNSKGWFTRFSQTTSCWTGSPVAFFLAVMVIVAWIVTGPIFKFSDTWQLVINTGTTIVTFLMVFLIQSSQNRDSKLIQLKLDELIRAVDTAETALIDMDEMSEEELKEVQEKFSQVAAEAREELKEVAAGEEVREAAPPRKVALHH